MDISKRLEEAYANGDVEEVTRLLSQPVDDKEGETPRAPSGLSRAGSGKTVSLDPLATEFMPKAKQSPSAAPTQGASRLDEDPVMAALRADFPNTKVSDLDALLLACHGNPAYVRVVLQGLDQVQVVEGRQTEGGKAVNGVDVDTEAYAAAVVQFDSQFPSLGGPEGRTGTGNAWTSKPSQSREQGSEDLLAKMRERGLAERMPWVSPATVAQALRSNGGNHEAAERNLGAKYPKPRDWDARQEQRRMDAVRQATASWSVDDNDGGNESGERARAGANVRWVRTGGSVSRLYEEKREQARMEARQRNKYFERAASATRCGNGVEAARLGALGRASNKRLHALQEEASDLLWNEQNPDFVREGLIDLHGLHVREALDRLPSALEEAAVAGRQSVSVVFGTGHHSVGGHGAPRLRPAVLEFFDAEGYSYTEIRDGKTNHVGAVSVDCKRLPR